MNEPLGATVRRAPVKTRWPSSHTLMFQSRLARFWSTSNSTFRRPLSALALSLPLLPREQLAALMTGSPLFASVAAGATSALRARAQMRPLEAMSLEGLCDAKKDIGISWLGGAGRGFRTARAVRAACTPTEAARGPKVSARTGRQVRPENRRTGPYGRFWARRLEATIGFEPMNRGFADLRLRPLGYVAPRCWLALEDSNLGSRIQSPLSYH